MHNITFETQTLRSPWEYLTILLTTAWWTSPRQFWDPLIIPIGKLMFAWIHNTYHIEKHSSIRDLFFIWFFPWHILRQSLRLKTSHFTIIVLIGLQLQIRSAQENRFFFFWIFFNGAHMKDFPSMSKHRWGISSLLLAQLGIFKTFI